MPVPTGEHLSRLTAQDSHPAAPLNYFFDSGGPASGPVLILDWILAGISVGVCVIIALLLWRAIAHRRAPARDEISGEERAGIRWILIGTVLSAVVLTGITIYTMIVLDETSRPPRPPALTITVTGYDWWWKAVYDDDDPAQRFTVANELHIPVGVPVRIVLKSADVIHAFWVPQLAGKTQMIPGLVNRQWIQADRPGRFRGACTQFCGLQHAHMGFEVVAQSREDFNAWRDAQRKPAPQSVNAQVAAGKKIFMNSCGACHTVRGSGANGDHAPDLTHLQSRRMIAAATLVNTPENLRHWIADTQNIKPGARMPETRLGKDDMDNLVAFLETLE